jgi:hypothetical protein
VCELESGTVAQIRMGMMPRKHRMMMIVIVLLEDPEFFDP